MKKGIIEMTLKKSLKYLKVIFFLIIASATVCRGFEAKEIIFLMDNGYFPEVKRLISTAKKSVQVMMFEASYYQKHPGSPSNQLIEALMDAAKRGVRVEVVLEVNKDNERTTLRNLETGKILKKAGVEVVFDPKYITTHSKLLIIDASIVVCGSTNWTYNALTKNHEVSAVIHSEEAARYLQDYFQVVKSTGKKL